MMKDKKENCVELNIHVECDKCHRPETSSSCQEDKHDEDDSCVRINVFVECEDKKHKYTI